MLKLILSLFPCLFAQPDLRPAPADGSQVIDRLGYSLCYADDHEQAHWVYYLVSADRLGGDVQRTDDFREDPDVITGSAALEDYRGSGYDRGHMCPAAVNKWSEQAMSESFFLSNISPQEPDFNQGVWLFLETRVRDWVTLFDSLYVVTGPVLRDTACRP
ncbi:DNA/RNA non-specific endonuclease [Fibrobacterota bacterium]